ncbi:MAG: hypothetical protein NT166_00340 [Candidatus Aminicenantes bacterium]|nr:hypothetical protein [Candidatus Aminicenantes bacterium]
MKSKMLVKTFVGILFMVILGCQAFPVWYVNKSGGGFVDTGVSPASVGLEDYVVAGAGYFLESYADTLLFMKKLEVGGENSLKDADTALLLEAALKNMEQAHKTYLELKRLADITPYNTAVADALIKFNYDGFQAAYSIDDRMFDRVRETLGKGDIRAVYGLIITDAETIIKRLNQVKSQVDAGAFPSTWDVWQLDRAYSDSARFGQYVSRIFDALNSTVNQ